MVSGQWWGRWGAGTRGWVGGCAGVGWVHQGATLEGGWLRECSAGVAAGCKAAGCGGALGQVRRPVPEPDTDSVRLQRLAPTLNLALVVFDHAVVAQVAPAGQARQVKRLCAEPQVARVVEPHLQCIEAQ